MVTDREVYNYKIHTLLTSGQYKKLNRDPPSKIEQPIIKSMKVIHQLLVL